MNASSINQTLKPIMIMAGGTGGHIFPALAVANALRAKNCPVVWLGAPDSMEARIVPENDIPLRTVNIGGVRGKGLKTKLLMPFKLLKAVWQARRIIKKEQPAAVVGFGGFVTGPGGLAAWLTGKPLLVHEQNAIAGMTNRYLAKFAKHVYEAFPQSFGSGKQVATVGNPIRKEIANLHAEFAANRPAKKQVLIVGGSLGAKALNETVPAAMSLIDEAQRPTITHQAGKRTLDVAKQAYQAANVEANVVEFINDMAAAYDAADLIICRAGALTVSEVTAAGLPAIFVPFPYAVDDHQRLNAESVANEGGAIVVVEKDLSVEKLASLIKELMSSTEKLNAMRQKSHDLAKLDAVDVIAKQCLAYASNDSNSLEVAA